MEASSEALGGEMIKQGLASESDASIPNLISKQINIQLHTLPELFFLGMECTKEALASDLIDQEKDSLLISSCPQIIHYFVFPERRTQR